MLMSSFRAERMIYGKLAGMDREHSVVAHSAQWPIEWGAPKGVGMPAGADFRGACSLEWYHAGTKRLLALSWCEIGPRITRRDFVQAHHLVADPQMFAQALPFLPEVVAQMRQIPIFDRFNPALAPFVFELPTSPTAGAAGEEWFHIHWRSLTSILTALLRGNSVFVHTRAPVEDKLQILAALMRILPAHLRAGLTFSTDEFGRRPYPRWLTFSHHHCATTVVMWEDSCSYVQSPAPLDSWSDNFGRILAGQGMAALIAELARPQYRTLGIGLAADLPSSL